MERNWILILAGIFLFLVGVWLSAGGPLPGATVSDEHQLNGIGRLLGLVPATLGAMMCFGAIPSRRK